MIDRYRLGPVVAVQWNPDLAARFPDADHNSCLQSMHYNTDTGKWAAHTPPLCHGYHCPECGEPVGSTGHRKCT